MEAILEFKSFSIKSIFKEYSVYFSQDSCKEILNNSSYGDVIFIDKNVNNLYPEITSTFDLPVKIINSNENQKNFSELHEYINFLIRNNFSKNNKIISIGGGVVQDITSFISSIYLRGVDWIFFPTNILTQCDSCIGSKSSINFKNYKNQLGGFYPPSKIFIDINFLKTIGREEIASGLGEMLHYFIINSFKDYKFFMENAELILEGDGDLLGSINKSLSIKKVMVELDEFDKGPRNIFNYGHSFGHALESVTNFSIPHGIAVAYGIDLANYLSVNYGFMKKETRNLIMKASKIVTDEFPLPQIEYDKYFEALKRDKKNIDNHFVFILAETIGKVSKAKVKDSSNLRSLITSYFDKKVYLTDI